MDKEALNSPGFLERMSLAFRILFNADLAAKVVGALVVKEPKLKPAAIPSAKPAAISPEKLNASGLFVLSALQQEGRLIDFLQQDVAAFSDEEVGAAARVVHAGCRKSIQQYVTVEPVLKDEEGSTIHVPAGFDAQRIRLTGAVSGQPPFNGALKHHGWVVKEVRFPTLAETVDHKVLAPAEVEIG
ncbi:MAG: DUF2760 domain-containing protein [Verrucomicrobiales bacterium]